jgi:hypothetical protein
MSETDGLSPVLKTQLLDGKVLLEHLCGAIQCHFDVGEDGKPLPVHQFESSENVEVVSLLVFAGRFTTGLERIPTYFDDLQKH